MRPWPSGLALLFALVALGAAASAPDLACAADTRAARASRLLASARRRIVIGTHEQRQVAITELEEAALLDPRRPDIPLALGRMYLEADLLHNARVLVQGLTARDSTLAGAWRLQGEVWRRYWLTGADWADRDRAIRYIAHGTRLDPDDAEGWMLLVPMLVHAGELEMARTAASYAVQASGDARARVLLAETSQRLGDLATAAREYARALPLLPAAERDCYTDVTPLMPALMAERLADMDSTRREAFVRELWAGADPDPVTPENEAQLEYWARVTQARALYGLPHDGFWDIRAQFYVRFGQPAYEEHNPVMLVGGFNTPADVLTWSYPDFGLRVVMSAATSLNGYPAVLGAPILWVLADADSLARHRELVPLYGGYAVFHRLAGDREPVDARLAMARFRSEGGTRLLAQIEAAGGIEDEWNVEWVLLDSTATAVARDRRRMSPSACEAESAKASSFAATVSPGLYRIGVQISDSSGARAVLDRRVYVSPDVASFSLSDLVITCGAPSASIAAGGVRLEPVTGLIPVDGDRLNAYVEIYGLASRASDRVEFTYECTVRQRIDDRRPWISRLFSPRERPPTIHMSRSETAIGPLRRQFMSVPVGSLPAGRYEFEVSVHARGRAADVNTVTSFERGP